MFINIILYSTNYYNLINFFKTLTKIFKLLNVRFSINKKFKKVSSSQISILKSPHVNKVGQEKFKEYRYSMFVKVKVSKPYLIIKIIKSTNLLLNSCVFLKITYHTKTKITKNLIKPSVKKITKNYLKLLDLKGEILFYKISLGSSVGRAKD